MKPAATFAYCCPSHRWAVTLAAGTEPLTCPPMTHERFDPGFLTGHTLLYFSLHGMPDQPYWYGEDFTSTALHTSAFAGLDLSGSVVFVANCYLAETPFLRAILDCHPRALVGGSGKNYTRTRTLVGAHLLGSFFRRGLQLRISPAAALALAKYQLTHRNQAAIAALAAHKDRATKRHLQENIAANQDALGFQIYTRAGGS